MQNVEESGASRDIVIRLKQFQVYRINTSDYFLIFGQRCRCHSGKKCKR